MAVRQGLYVGVAKTLDRAGNAMGSSTQMGVDPARDRRPQDSSNDGNLRVQKLEFGLHQETLTA